MPLTYHVTRFQIAVPLTDKQWERLEKIEKDWENSEPGSIDIHKTLEALGGQRVDWSGHFGQYIYFWVDADFEKDPEFGQSDALVVSTKLEELLGKE